MNKEQKLLKTIKDNDEKIFNYILKEKSIKELEMLAEIVEGMNLCDYPKSKTQQEHSYNIKLIDQAEKQAKEVITRTLKNTITELKKLI